MGDETTELETMHLNAEEFAVLVDIMLHHPSAVTDRGWRSLHAKLEELRAVAELDAEL